MSGGERWCKLHVGFFRNSKSVAAGKNGQLLYLAALCWSRDQMTDGAIPAAMLPALASDAWQTPDEAAETAAVLVAEGLWDKGFVTRDSNATRVTTGWTIHDYTGWQTTREDVDMMRTLGRERQRRYRETVEPAVTSTNTESVTALSRVTDALPRSASNGRVTEGERERETEKEIETPRARKTKPPASPEARKLAQEVVHRWAEWAGATEPNASNKAIGEVQLLLDAGPVNAKKGTTVSEDRVRQMIDLVFTKGTRQWSDGGSWAKVVTNGEKLRKHWTSLEGNLGGNGAQVRQVAASDRSLSSNGEGSYVDAELAEARERGRLIEEKDQ